MPSEQLVDYRITDEEAEQAVNDLCVVLNAMADTLESLTVTVDRIAVDVEDINARMAGKRIVHHSGHAL